MYVVIFITYFLKGKKEFDLEINYVGSTISDTDKALHEKEIESYIISDKMPYRFTFSLGGNF